MSKPEEKLPSVEETRMDAVCGCAYCVANHGWCVNGGLNSESFSIPDDEPSAKLPTPEPPEAAQSQDAVDSLSEQLRKALARIAALEQRIRFEDDITPLPCGCPTFCLYMNGGSLVCGKCGRTYMLPLTLHAEKEAAEARVARLKPYVSADVFDWSEKESEK